MTDPVSAAQAPTEFNQITVYVLAFASAFCGSVVAPAFLEAWKDRVGSWRSRNVQERQTLEFLRFTLAELDAFWRLKDSAIGMRSKSFPETAEFYQRALMNFDLKPISDAIEKFKMVGVKLQDTAAPAQFMMSNLRQVVSLMRILQTDFPNVDGNLIKDLDRKKDDLHIFIVHVYAKYIKIPGFPLLFDREMMKFTRDLAKWRVCESQNELNRRKQDMEDVLNQNRQEKNETDSPS